ncbi:rhomboid family intramembrane serine protease [Haloferula chungangensis]|uniref:Rhomboid family intramembrane serine protease n=1 Tax=Haloferula chungangensis TaxID=1048331 RepID=A0ABW2L7W0_9BACT
MPEGIAEEVEELAVVGQWSSLDEAYENALVVLAMNLDCFIREVDGFFAIEVEPERERLVRHELSEYAAEQQLWRERAELPVGAVGMELALIWVLSLVGIFLFQIKDPSISDRFCNSAVDVVAGGEWWRTFTALFLHADAPHLLGNVFIGGVFCYFVAQSFGQLRGWMMILASGVLGNSLNALYHFPENFYSLGASTATFGAMGLLVGLGVVLAWKSRTYRMLKPVMVPLATGLIMLGWYGVGDGNTDVLAHVFGWSSGVVLGVVVAGKMETEVTP